MFFYCEGRDLRAAFEEFTFASCAGGLKLAPAGRGFEGTFIHSSRNNNQKFPLQDRPEFSEVVSNLEECLCNVEVHFSPTIPKSYNAPSL